MRNTGKVKFLRGRKMREGVDVRWENREVGAKLCSSKLNLYSASCLPGKNSK